MENSSINNSKNVSQEQIHDLLFSKEIGWQEIIYDLINTEQLDPWNIDIIILSDGFLKKVEELEEADFFISGKVLLAAALLLRIKSEILLNKYIKSIDEILFDNKKEKPNYHLERIELDEEIPELIPRSPLPRFRKVSLKELMDSLNKAIITENRRIKKEIINKNALRESSFSLPKRRFSIKDKILEIYNKLFSHLGNEERIKIGFTELIGESKEEKISSFAPLLHLENQKKIWLHQNEPFEEIEIWLKKVYFKHNPNPFENLNNELENNSEDINDKEFSENIDEENENPFKKKKAITRDDIQNKKRLNELNKDFTNPLADFFGDN